MSASGSDSSTASPDRIRQFHGNIVLLDTETRSARRAERLRRSEVPVWLGVPADGFVKGLVGAIVLLVAAISLWTYLACLPDERRVPDYRRGVRYDETEASDALHHARRRSLFIATRGSGVHELDLSSGYFRQHTHSSTGNKLPSDDVVRIQSGTDGSVFFLCAKDQRRALARATGSMGRSQWQTLFGFDEGFPALADGPLAGQISAVRQVGDTLWFATPAGGIGVYHPESHAWQAVHSASPKGLLDDRVHDLAVDSDGAVWVATAGGINRFHVEENRWDRFVAKQTAADTRTEKVAEKEGEGPIADVLVGSDVLRLHRRENELWYVTAGGGVGCFDGKSWRTVAPENGWDGRNDGDVVHVIQEANSRKLWFVDRKQTLARYDRTTRCWDSDGWASCPDTANGQTITALADGTDEDRFVLWVGTGNGLYAFDPQDGEKGKWTPAPIAALPVEALDAAAGAVVVKLAPSAADRPPCAYVRAEKDAWRKAVGDGAAAVGPRGILAVAQDDGEPGSLFVGSEEGISVYRLAEHDWIDSQAINEGRPPGDVLDLQFDRAGRSLLALSSQCQLSRWSLADEEWTDLLGGDRFPARMADLTAVTRGGDGRLWLATAESGVHVYEPKASQWHALPIELKNVAHLAADRRGVWCVVGGEVYYYVEGDEAARPVDARLSAIVKLLFAVPDTDGAIAVDKRGHVVLLAGDGSVRTIVGDAAEGLDFKTVSCVGAVDGLVVLGGPRPSAYRPGSRSWTPLGAGDVTQVVPAVGRLWLRNQQGKVYRVSSADAQITDVTPDSPILELAGRGDELVALGRDGSVYRRGATDGDWQTLVGAAGGPAPDLLIGPNVAVEAVGEDLYVAGGSGGRAWHFSWTGQSWKSVVDAAGRPLGGVTRLASGGGRVFALVLGAGEIHSIAVGESQARREQLTQVAEIRSTGSVVVATDRSGDVFVFDAEGWRPMLAASSGLPAGATLTDAAVWNGGTLFGASRGSAWLSPDLASWTTVDADFGVKRLILSPSQRAMWALADSRRLYRLEQDAAAMGWKPVEFPGAQSPVKHVAAWSGADSDELWACLDDGSLYRVAEEGATVRHKPSAAPGPPEDVVGVVQAPGGSLVGFRKGKLATLDGTRRQWSPASAPQTAGIAELLAVSDQGNASWWILGTDGKLFRATPNRDPAWEPVGSSEVSDIAAAGSELLAVCAPRRAFVRFDAAGTAASVFASRGFPEGALGKIVAAGEIADPNGGSILVLAGEQRIYAYRAATHGWTSHDAAVEALHPNRDGLAALTADGRIARLKWVNDDLELSRLPTPGDMQAVRIATSGDDNRVVAILDDGRLVLFDDGAAARHLSGRILPPGVDQSRIADVAVSGERLFLALEDGDVHVYDHKTRDWSLVRSIGGTIVQLTAEGDVLWVEIRIAGRASLGRFELSPQDGTWAGKQVAKDVLGWHRAPHGLVVDLKREAGVETHWVKPSGESEPLLPAPSLGPPSDEVTGLVAHEGNVWMRTAQGQLWHYHRLAGQWSQVDLGPDETVASARLRRKRPLVLTAAGSLHRGSPGAGGATSWTFEKIASGVIGFDADDEHAAYCTDQKVVLLGQEATTELTFQEAGWESPEARLVAAVGRDDELWVATDANEVAAYQLAKRRWEVHPKAPWAVEQLFFAHGRLHAVGADGELAALAEDGWQAARQTSQTSWQSNGRAYAIDESGRLSASSNDPADTAAEESGPQLAFPGAPLRLHADAGSVWIECADSSLWRLEVAKRRFSQMVAAPEGGGKRTGLLAVGGRVFFVAENEGVVRQVDEEQGVLRSVEMPDDGEGKPLAVGVREDGLLLSTDDSGVLVAEGPKASADGDELASWKEQAQKPDAARMRSSGAWMIRAPEDGGSDALAHRFGKTWREVAVDAESGRFALDLAIGGLSHDGLVYAVTKAGIAVLDPTLNGMPKRLFALQPDGREPSDLRLWAVKGTGVVAADGGRIWLLPGPDSEDEDPEPIPAPESRWVVSLEVDPPAITAEWERGNPVPVSLEGSGRFGFDAPRSVALYNGSLFLSTADGLCESPLEKADLLVPAKVHDVQGGELLVSTDGQQLQVRHPDETVRAYDGTSWTDPAQPAEVEPARRELRDRGEGERLTFTLDSARDGQEPFETEYRDRSLVHDLAPAAGAMTADGARIYTIVDRALVIRDAGGTVESLHRPEGGVAAMAWTALGTDAPSLLLQGKQGGVLRVGDSGLEAVSGSWEELAAGGPLAWRGESFDLSFSSDRSVAWLDQTSQGDRITLDLAQRGWVRDRFLDVGLTGQAAWVASAGRLERIPLQPGVSRLAESLESAAANVRMRSLTTGLHLLADDGARRLSETGTPAGVELGETDRLELAAFHFGPAWRVESDGPKPRVLFRDAQDGWADAGLDPNRGLGCDVPRAVVGTERHVVLFTTAGLFVADRSETKGKLDLTDLAALSLPPRQSPALPGTGSAPSIDLWADHEETIWARYGGEAAWYSLDVDNMAWGSPGALPEASQEARDLLCRTDDGVVWRWNGDALELVEPTRDGEPVVSVLRADRRFDFDRVGAAARTDQGLWLCTVAGPRLVDPETGQLLAADPSAQLATDDSTLHRVGDSWYLEARRENARTLFGLVGRAWSPLEPGTAPLDGPRQLATGERLRVVRRDGQVQCELKVAAGEDAWRPCGFLADRARFDFQFARDAAAVDGFAHVLTEAGMTTWSRGANGLSFVSLRSDLEKMTVPHGSGRILCANAAGQWEQCKDFERWEAAEITDEQRATLAESPRWRCRTAGEGVSLEAADASGAWVGLALDPEGDFAFRHPSMVRLTGDDESWTATTGMIVRHAAGAWIPKQFWPAKALLPDAPSEVRRLPVVDGTLYADLQGTLFSHTPAGEWQKVDDPAEILQKQDVLFADEQWHWERTPSGAAARLTLPGGQTFDLPWDGAARFEWDVVDDAAASGGSIWLRSQRGLAHLSEADGVTTALLELDPDSATAFCCQAAFDGDSDPPNVRLFLTSPGGEDDARYVRAGAAGAIDLDEAVDPNEAAAVVTAMYRDNEWTFEREDPPRLLWRGHASGIVDGRFLHDQFLSMTCEGSSLWVPTPVALLRYGLDTSGLTLNATYPFPDGAKIVEVVEATSAEVLCRADDAAAIRLHLTEENNPTWTPAAGASAAEPRTLVDRSLWKWTRDPQGGVRLTVKPCDRQDVEPILTAESRFPFDDATACLIDGRTVWFGGAHGVVRQALNDGQDRDDGQDREDGERFRWYRTGTGEDGEQALKGIVRLGRFRDDGTPVPSWAADEALQAAELYALSSQGAVWRFQDEKEGSWQAAQSNPFDAAEGEWLLKSEVLDAIRRSDGTVRLLYHDCDASQSPVLQDGRLSVDDVRSVAFAHESVWLGTAAGIVECDAADGSFRRLWAEGSDEAIQGLGQCRAVLKHQTDGQLYAHTEDNRVFLYDASDPESSGPPWRKLEQAGPGFREGAEVLFDDDFWTWFRWNKQVDTRLKRVGPDAGDWPLFAGGRFSFDVLRSIRTEGDLLLAATAGGVLHIAQEDASIRRVDCTARDVVDGRMVPMLDVVDFSEGMPIEGLAERYRYEWRSGGWQRTLEAGREDDGLREDGDLAWQITARSDGKVQEGFTVSLADSRGASLGSYQVLPGVPKSRLKKVVAADGRLWLLLDRGLYVLTPR